MATQTWIEKLKLRICVHCGKAIGDSPIRSLEWFIIEQHPLLKDCRSNILHKQCFRRWKHRRLYIHLFNEYHKSIDGEDYSIQMKQNGLIKWHDKEDAKR